MEQIEGSRRLIRVASERKILGVCGGVGLYFNVDPTVVRLVWIVVTMFGGIFPGVILYFVAGLIIPDEKG
ncbi:PspC domain-containing protein [candidate division KSB1 bacterium]